MLLLPQCILARHGKSEFCCIADVACKAALDHLNDVLCDGVWRKVQRLWHRQIALRRFPVLGVKIPLPTFGRVSVHHKTGLTPHIAIEKFHAQLFAVLGPAFKFSMGAQEAVIRPDFYQDIKAVGPAIQHRFHPPFACLGHA